jgi:drug/metabolite transporter (DMT)-like permease
MSRLNADIALLLAAAVWGVAFLFQKSAMDHVGPLAFIAARAALAAVALAPLAWREHRRAAARTASPGFRPGFGPGFGPGLWGVAIWGGAAFFVAAWLQQAGIRTATVTNTSFLTALYVVLTPFVAWAWSGKLPGGTVWPAVALSTLGTWLLGGGGTLSGLGHGDALVALCALFWAIHVVITGRAARLGRPVGFTAVQFAVVAVLAALGSAAFETTTLRGLAGAAPDILYVGLLSSALTFTILIVALQYTPPSEAAVIVSMESVFAALAAFVVLGERLPAIGWLGAALILGATLLLQLGPAIGARLGRARAAPAEERGMH